MKFNINNNVKVKLTQLGLSIHRANHFKLYNHYPMNSRPVYVPPEQDKDGWSTWQLWDLMKEFGGHLYNGAQLPFETEIELIEDPPK